jgi:hypothetical protein
MKGLNAFQMAQLKHRDARVFMLCQHPLEILPGCAGVVLQPVTDGGGDILLGRAGHPDPHQLFRASHRVDGGLYLSDLVVRTTCWSSGRRAFGSRSSPSLCLV